MYETDKIGSFDKVSCKCGWKGLRADLKIISRYEDIYDEYGELVWIEDYDGCPICLNEEVVDEIIGKFDSRYPREEIPNE